MSVDGMDTSSSDGVDRAGAVIGGRLRGWRQEKGQTLSDIAESCGLSIGYVSQVERGLANPSLEVLKRLTDAIGRRVGDLFDADVPGSAPTPAPAAASQRYWVTRTDERKRIQYPGSGIVNELVTPDLRRQIEAIWVEAPVGSTSGGHPHSHAGEECGIVLSGTMQFWVDEQEQVLEAGDSIYLDSTLPHRWTAIGDEDLRAIWLITPPTF